MQGKKRKKRKGKLYSDKMTFRWWPGTERSSWTEKKAKAQSHTIEHVGCEPRAL